MKRRALIIGSPGAPGAEDYLPGVEKDIGNFRSYLASPTGGAWDESEISTLKNPTKANVLSGVEWLKGGEYSFVVFSGHGKHSMALNSAVIQLGPGVELNSVELRVGAARHTLILDCCRHIVDDRATKADFASAMLKEERSSVIASRQKFDRELERCPPGMVLLSSCSMSEMSDDTSAGGRFSLALLDAASNWRSGRFSDDVLSIVAAFDSAKPGVQKSSGYRQTPDIEKPRSSPYFPFAV